ncbi:uncharacterized protein N7459_000228 [Penicillium hispanicum]|uniref:uncharacterized protein n=1 Tax=Penicillium hispanicum TaxID=1080232 RepID=UPI0025413120|nr:uncharacterized protein N7459_000228 [Penicillium hispanicum]KAJ5594020.1 hypothetical protein N7459_000228 [Penicillium hispanicum]
MQDKSTSAWSPQEVAPVVAGFVASTDIRGQLEPSGQACPCGGQIDPSNKVSSPIANTLKQHSTSEQAGGYGIANINGTPGT